MNLKILGQKRDAENTNFHEGSYIILFNFECCYLCHFDSNFK